MTLASIPLMDRTGRRTLHLYGLGGMFIFSIFITISFLIKASTQRMLRIDRIVSGKALRVCDVSHEHCVINRNAALFNTPHNTRD